MTERAFVAGVGMTTFTRPGDRTYPALVAEAVNAALADAGIGYQEVQRAAAGYVFQPSTAGQRALYDIGLTGIPIVNVNNNCATGSTALMLATEWVRAGLAEVALAVGFEQMTRESMTGSGPPPEVTTIDRHLEVLRSAHEPAHEPDRAPPMAQFFGHAAAEHMARYGTTAEQLARIAVKNHEHSTRNPYAQFQHPLTLEQVLADKPVHGPLTRSQCSPISDGAAAAVVLSGRSVRARGLRDKAVEVVAQSMVTDTGGSFGANSMIDVVGAPMTRQAAAQVFAASGRTIGDVDVIELHDCFSVNELITYEALGMCAPGEAGRLADAGATTYGGRWVVNPSGGLISKGHPLGATGLAQCAELTWQLRGEAGARQVPGARLGLAHNLGLGGACVVTLYRALSAGLSGTISGQVVQADDVGPALAEIPVADVIGVDDRPQHSGLPRGQFAEHFAARADDHAGTVLTRVGDVGRKHIPLVRRRVADQVTAPDPGGHVRVCRVGEVDEDLCSGGGEVLPLLGIHDLPAELNADGHRPAVQPKRERRQSGPGLQPPSLMGGQVDLPVGPPGAAGRQVHRRVAPGTLVRHQRAAEQMDVLLPRQFGETADAESHRIGVEPVQSGQVVVVAGHDGLWQHHDLTRLGVGQQRGDRGEIALDIPGDRRLRHGDRHFHEPLPPMSPNRHCPSTKVASTSMSAILSGATANGSSDRTTRSASRPAAITPLTCSAWLAYADPLV
jgi:acetyl-CoA acetyltransferase